MSHILSLAWTDLRVLYRTGYIWVTVAIFLVLLTLALQLSQLDLSGLADVVAALILLDVVVAPVMLVVLMILLERGDGSLLALAATPMKLLSYLVARVAVVAAICAAEMFFLVLIVYDAPLSVGALAAGLLSAAAIAAVSGVIVVAPFSSLYSALPPMVGWILLLSAPAYGVLMGWEPLRLAWHPTAPAMALIAAAFDPQPVARVAYGAAGAVLWLTLGGALAARALRAMQRRAAGGS